MATGMLSCSCTPEPDVVVIYYKPTVIADQSLGATFCSVPMFVLYCTVPGYRRSCMVFVT